MWDGSYKSKKQVSLRGKSSKQQDRRVLKNKIKAEREKRARDKQEQVAAIKIQCWTRGILDIRIAVNRMRAEWDAELREVIKQAQTIGAGYVPSPDLLLTMSRQLSFFLRPNENASDAGRLLVMCKLILKSLQIQDLNQNFRGNLLAKPSARLQWAFSMVQFISLCLAQIARPGEKEKTAADAIMMETVSLLVTPIDPNLRQVTNRIHVTLSSTSLNGPFGIVNTSGFKNPIRTNGAGFTDALAMVVSQPTNNSKIPSWLCELLSESINENSNVCDVFVNTVLTQSSAGKNAPIRSLLWKQDAVTQNHNTFHKVVESAKQFGEEVYEQFSTLSSSDEYSPPTNLARCAAAMLSNLIALVVRNTEDTGRFLRGEQEDSLNVLASCFLVLLKVSPTDILDGFSMPSSSTNLWQGWSTRGGGSGNIQENFTFNRLEGDLPLGITDTAKALVNMKFVIQLLSSVLINNRRSKSKLSISAVTSVCELFRHISTYWTSVRKRSEKGVLSLSPSASVLYASAFSSKNEPVVMWLWDLIIEVSNDQHWLESYSTIIGSEYCGLVTFACSASMKRISTLDDEELFKKDMFVHKEKISVIATFLRDLLYQAVWVAGASRSAAISIDQSMVVNAIQLYGQLYERYSRHPFMPPEEWLFTNVSPLELGIGSSGAIMEVDESSDEDEAESDDGESVTGGDSNARQTVSSTPVGVGVGVTLSGTSERGKVVLRFLSQTVSFDHRVSIFTQLLEQSIPQSLGFNSRIQVTVSRDELYADAFKAFKDIGPGALRGRLQISFVNQYGLDEAGVDGGGVLKEFLVEFTKKAFDPEMGLWKTTENGKMYPNPGSSLAVEDHLAHYEFVGRVLGKAVYEGVLVEPEFADFFLNLLLGKTNQIHDLQSLDPEYYHHLMAGKRLPDPSVLSLTFTATRDTDFGGGEEVDLVYNGRNIPVTKSNYLEYVQRVSDFRLNVQLHRQAEAFRRGFNDLVDSKWIQMFQPREVQLLIGGSDNGYDVADLRANTHYRGYHDTQPYMHWFWEIVDELGNDERAKLLNFVTSCPRPPLQGFKALSPNFTIHEVAVSNDGERLPTASTCVNLLKLPRYSSKEVLRQKLKLVINSAAGFELS